jgi:hypothetical protein
VKLKKLYAQARKYDAMALSLYHSGDWQSFHAIIALRNAFMEVITAHPKNPHTRLAVMCRVISGLSGREDEVKV